MNGLQIDGKVEKIKKIEPIEDKWESFGWNTFSIDGHSFLEIIHGIEKAQKSVNGRPNMIILKTHKGKGVSFMEDKVEYHGVAPTREELKKALIELTGEYKGIRAYL